VRLRASSDSHWLSCEATQGKMRCGPLCFEAWPEDALEMVANKFLEEVELEDSVRQETVIMCKHFHTSVRLMSERYYAELLRYNYVTPTSYLELILTFKKLLALKRDDIQMLRDRYVTGLEKLEFAASQVLFAVIGLSASRVDQSVHHYIITNKP